MLSIGFFGDMTYTWSLRAVGGALRYCREHKQVQLRDFLFTSPQSLDDGPPPWRGKVDGVILATNVTGGVRGANQWLKQGGVPGVSVVSNFVSPEFPSVFMDPASVAKLAFHELTQRECSLLLCIGFVGSQGTRLRNNVFVELASSAGIPVRTQNFNFDVVTEEDVIQARKRIAKVLKTLYAVSKNRSGALGILAPNDAIARWVLDACDTLKLTVPQQVSVVGVDDSPLAFSERPTITSVQHPGDAVGYRAVEVLLSILSGKSAPSSPVLVPAPGIAVRESTGGASEGPDNMNLALELVRRQACSGQSIEEITSQLPLSSRSLQRLFRERLGISPTDEMKRVRLAKTRELLEDSEWSISRIAELVGFSETAALSKFFKQQTGISPREYRQHRSNKSTSVD